MASSNPSSRGHETSESISIGAAIKAVQALPDMDEDLIMDVCDFFRNPQNGERFMALYPKLRKRWLIRNLLRSGQIHVVTMSGSRFCLEVAAADTIAVVKAKIEGKKGFPTKDQRLLYCGRELEDGRTLDYNVRSDSALHMVFRLCGC